MADTMTLNANALCSGFPTLEGPQVRRDNMILAIEGLLTSHQAVIVDGQVGIGKTTLLAQFARKHNDATASLFVTTASRYAFDPALLLFDLCSQLMFILKGAEMRSEDDATESLLHKLYLDAARRAKAQQSPFYIVVDGMCDIPPEQLAVRSAIVNWLPLGLSSFKVIVSGECAEEVFASRRVRFKTFTLPALNLHECEELLEVPLSAEQLKEVVNVTKGVPEFVSAVARQLRSGTSAEALLSQLPETLPSLFKMEWGKVGDNPSTRLVLAVLAFSEVGHTVADLARILKRDLNELRSVLAPLEFLSRGDATKPVDFVSPSFKAFAQSQLSALKARVDTLVVDSLISNPDSKESLMLLPAYLQRQGATPELLQYLTGSRLALMIERSHLRGPALDKAHMGMDAAFAAHREADGIRLGIAATHIRGYTAYASSRAEIEARMAVGEYERALHLAQAATLRDDRLRLLAAIARKQKESGLMPASELAEQITELVLNADPMSSEEAADLAADLVYVRPELALRLMDAARSPGRTSDLDWAYARVSLEAVAAGIANDDTLKSLRQRIKNPEVERLTSALWLMMRGYSAQQVLAEVERVPSDADKLFLIRQWAQHGRPNTEAAPVLKRALDLCLRAVEYTPNATHLRELATALNRVNDRLIASELIGAFDTLAAGARDVGPSEDYVRMQLLLAEREAGLDFKRATDRLLEAYFFVMGLKDVSVRAVSWAHCVAKLPAIDPERRLESTETLHTLVRDGLGTDVETLLVSTADHWLVTKRIIGALARSSFEDARAIAQSLNTEPRRDVALLHGIREAVRQRVSGIPLRAILKSLDQFAHRAHEGHAVAAVLERFSQIGSDSALEAAVEELQPFIARAARTEEAAYRAHNLKLALAILARVQGSEYTQLKSAVRKGLDDAWAALDETAHKVELGFTTATAMAQIDRDTAIEYLGRANERRVAIGNDDALDALEYSLRLCVRAYAAVIGVRTAAPEDLAGIEGRIAALPSLWTQSVLLSEVAVALYGEDLRALADKLVEQHLRPKLKVLEVQDVGAFRHAVRSCMPALYRFHKRTALEWAASLPPLWRDAAYWATIEHILDKLGPRDQFESKDYIYRMRWVDAIDVLEVLERAEEDSLIYRAIRAVARSVSAKANRRDISREQREDIGKRLEKVIAERLPNARYIRHEGFVVASLAEVFRIRKHASTEWDALVARARVLPNASDVAFVLGIIAEASSDALRRSALVKEAFEVMERIAEPRDRASRLRSLAESAPSEKAIAKKCIMSAARSATADDTEEGAEFRRSIVDTAYAVDPKWAETVIGALDPDPARAKGRRDMQERLDILKRRKQFIERQFKDPGADWDVRNTAEAAWSYLGALNAGRVSLLSPRERHALMGIAAKGELSETFPIVAVVVESMRRAFVQGKDAAGARRLFDTTLEVVDFANTLWRGNAASVGQVAARAEGRAASSQIVRPGERDSAMEALASFLQAQPGSVLRIADPYLGPEDVAEILQLVRRQGIERELRIVTSRRHYVHADVEQPWDDAIRKAWKRVSEESAPPTTVVIVGLGPGGESPIHERWWLTEGEGLRVGTSFAALGQRRASEWSRMNVEECKERVREFEEYFGGRRRVQGNEQIAYVMFGL